MKKHEYEKIHEPTPSQTLIPWLLEAIPASTFDKVRLVLSLTKTNHWEPPPLESLGYLTHEQAISAAHEQCAASRDLARYGRKANVT